MGRCQTPAAGGILLLQAVLIKKGASADESWTRLLINSAKSESEGAEGTEGTGQGPAGPPSAGGMRSFPLHIPLPSSCLN